MGVLDNTIPLETRRVFNAFMAQKLHSPFDITIRRDSKAALALHVGAVTYARAIRT